MTLNNQIVGLMRFSYPAREGFRVSTLSEPELEAMLYDPARLDRRFAYLETLALPSLAAQTDPDFRLVILHGTSLPGPHAARLAALADTYPFLRVVALDRMGAMPSTRRAIQAALTGAPDRVTNFRIDDDDALAVDYVARLRARAGALIGAGLADAPCALAYSDGLYWDLHDPVSPFRSHVEICPPAIACAVVVAGDLPITAYRYNHRRLATFVPTWIEPAGAPMYLRTLHGHNDSERDVPPRAEPIALPRARAMLADRFGLDPDAALALMPEAPAP